MTLSPPANHPDKLRRTAKPLGQFLANRSLDWQDLVRLMLVKRAPNIAVIADKLLVFGEDEITWDMRERILARLSAEQEAEPLSLK